MREVSFSNATIGFATLCLVAIGLGGLDVQQAEARDILKPDRKPVFCRELERHQPGADVAFQPGVDATGRAVAPADLPSNTQFRLPDEFSFPLTVDVIEWAGLDESFSGLEGELDLGDVTVSGNDVTLNGKTVPNLSRADIVALCVTKPGIR
ncbi:MAG: hypothetical protein KI792_06210 [Alphaproteobacteria bacterium]|nr:hypothetical protein [Alphaproteobacteria bacterium SS10]